MARLPADPSFEEMKARGGEPDLHDEPHTVSNDQVWISGEIPRTTDFEDGLIGSIQYIGGKWETDPVRFSTIAECEPGGADPSLAPVNYG